MENKYRVKIIAICPNCGNVQVSYMVPYFINDILNVASVFCCNNEIEPKIIIDKIKLLAQ